MRIQPRIITLICVTMLAGMLFQASTFAELRRFAYDDASNYTNWGAAGLNEGVGFDTWVIRADQPGTSAAGAFLANTNSQTSLNSIGSGPEGKAWGTYANGGGPSDFPKVAAFRGFAWNGAFWGNRLENPGDTFKISLENVIFAKLESSCGFALRNGNDDFSADNYNSNDRFQFGLYADDTVIDQNYSIFDNNGKRDTGVLRRDSGLDLVFTLVDSDTYSFSIYDATNSVFLTNIVGTLSGSGTLDSVSLFNRDTDTVGDTFFNKMEIWKIVWPTTFILK